MEVQSRHCLPMTVESCETSNIERALVGPRPPVAASGSHSVDSIEPNIDQTEPSLLALADRSTVACAHCN